MRLLLAVLLLILGALASTYYNGLGVLSDKDLLYIHMASYVALAISFLAFLLSIHYKGDR